MLRALLLFVALAPAAVWAQAYPTKPIRWILGYPPGGGTEFIARNVANTISAHLGQPIVIENRPGAAAILGADAAARGQIAAGKVRVLAVAAKKRLEQLPDVPTFAELGYADFEVYFWQGMAVPAGTPHEIVNRLSAELVKTLKTAEVAKRFIESGMQLGAGTPEDMARTIREDQKFWVPFVKSLGISVD